jgi:hypothetical protein
MPKKSSNPSRRVSMSRIETRLSTLDDMAEELFQRKMKFEEEHANMLQKLVDEKLALLEMKKR